MNEKISNILYGIIVLVFGILIAVVGISEVIDIYFGIGLCIAGAGSLAFAIYCLATKQPLPVGSVILAGIALSIGIALFTPALSFGVLEQIIVFALLGLGAALVLIGILDVVKKILIFGLGEITLGALLLAFTIVYLNVADFQKVFWIIVGILVAVYGVWLIIGSFINTKKITKK